MFHSFACLYEKNRMNQNTHIHSDSTHADQIISDIYTQRRDTTHANIKMYNYLNIFFTQRPCMAGTLYRIHLVELVEDF